MSLASAPVEVLIGNVVGQILGPVPLGELDRALNPHLGRASWDRRYESEKPYAEIFDPVSATFLAGGLAAVKRALRQQKIRFRIRDCRHEIPAHERMRWHLMGPDLREYQREVVEAAIEAGGGVIDIGTGGGKTLLAAAIIARLGIPTLYLVTTRPLLSQTLERLSAHLPDAAIGVIGDGQREPRELTVALVQALTRSTEELSRWKNGCLVFDEGHHASAPTYLDLVRRVDARHNYFLSAVPYRSGDDQIVLDTLTGGSLTGRRFSAKYLIDHGYACPAQVRVEVSPITTPTSERPFEELYRQAIVENAQRNERIVEIANAHVRKGEETLLLVDRIRHGEILARKVARSAFVHGGTPKGHLRELTERFSSGQLPCLIATTGLFQEGVDIHGIQALIHAGGMKSRVRVLQTIGRGLRTAPGKACVHFVDFFDDDSASGGILRAHSLQRLAILRSEGFFIAPLEEERVHQPVETEIAPAWHHLEGTRRFLLVGPAGEIVEEKECVEPRLVPNDCCKGCARRAACGKEVRK